MAGVRVMARIRASPAMSAAGGGRPRASRATVEVGDPGATVVGRWPAAAASLTTPTGAPPLVTVTMPPGLGVLRAAYRLGERQVTRDGERAPGQVAGDQDAGSRRRTRAALIDAVAPVHRNRAMTKART